MLFSFLTFQPLYNTFPEALSAHWRSLLVSKVTGNLHCLIPMGFFSLTLFEFSVIPFLFKSFSLVIVIILISHSPGFSPSSLATPPCLMKCWRPRYLFLGPLPSHSALFPGSFSHTHGCGCYSPIYITARLWAPELWNHQHNWYLHGDSSKAPHTCPAQRWTHDLKFMASSLFHWLQPPS